MKEKLANLLKGVLVSGVMIATPIGCNRITSSYYKIEGNKVRQSMGGNIVENVGDSVKIKYFDNVL